MPGDHHHYRLAIIGAGFGGLGAAIMLKRQGIDDFVVFDRAEDVGGTWRANTYPGCCCDVPSQLYSFSFALNPQWTHSFSPQPEIWAYLRACADRFGVTPHLRLGYDVQEASWDDDAKRWLLDTSHGRFTADVLVAAAGPLNEPAVPKLPGLETFTGEVFHSARWRHDLDLTGRRVAVIGTGASAAQFIPAIASTVDNMVVFQRTAPWVMPKSNRRFTRFEQGLYRAVPPVQRLVRWSDYWLREVGGTGFLRPAVMRLGERVARRHLRRQILDETLRAALTPDYRMGCKRVVLADDFYPALARPNVTLVTSGIREVCPQGMVDGDGTVHEVDTIIFGTGFHVTDAPMSRHIRGRDGATLAEAWQGSMHAYLGTMVAGFPNLFLLLGPHTGLGHNSVVFMAEAQLRFLRRALGRLAHRRELEPTPEAQTAYSAEMDRRMRPTVWASGGCRSWYADSTGRISALWPGYSFSYWLRLRRFDPHAFRPVEATP